MDPDSRPYNDPVAFHSFIPCWRPGGQLKPQRGLTWVAKLLNLSLAAALGCLGLRVRSGGANAGSVIGEYKGILGG